MLLDLVLRERGTLTRGYGARTMVHGIDCEGGGSAAIVILWKRRYAAEGIGGLGDRPKPGMHALSARES